MTLQNPFVIQCNSCNSILADSFSLLNNTNDSLIFSHTSTNINIDPDENTSNLPYDKACKYNRILCKCKYFVGKKYFTINKDMIGYLDNYVFFKSEIKSYQLGCSVTNEPVTLSGIAEEISKIKKVLVMMDKYAKKTKK